MIWVFEDGPFFDGSRRFIEESKVEFVFVGLNFNLKECTSIHDLIETYRQRVKRTLTTYELESILPQAWRFANAVSMGDYAVVSCYGSALIGKISGAYTLETDHLGKTRHSYRIDKIAVLRNSERLPGELRKLATALVGQGEQFGDTSTALTLDEHLAISGSESRF